MHGGRRALLQRSFFGGSGFGSGILSFFFGGNAILTEAIAKEEKVLEPADDLLAMEGMDTDMAKLLASKGIVSMEDLAELAVDELLDLVKVDEEKAKNLIMTARAPWFV